MIDGAMSSSVADDKKRSRAAPISKRRHRKKLWIAVSSAVAITLFFIVLLVNLHSGEREIRYQLAHQFSVSDPQFLRSMNHLLGPGILPGNKVTAFQNGAEIFPAMLKAIRGAQKTITFETYIYWSGNIGREFADALCERARAGVKVHVLLDWVGSGKIEDKYIEDMRAAGAEVQRYHPLRWYTIHRINKRTHRKLLVVDGKIAFTGGVGIADLWNGHAEDKDHWRDSQYSVEGPAAAEMQTAFNDNWIKTRATVLFGADYYPELKPVGPSYAQVFKSSAGEGTENIRLMYLLSIASATNSVLLSASYFVPDDLAVQTFAAARKRGVNIEIIVPGPIADAKIVQKASRSRWGELLDAGVKIYEYQPTMYHCKVLIVDGIWVSVGSTNFDDRSFRLNDEANLNVYDANFAAEQIKVFEADRKVSRQVIRSEFKERSRLGKLVEETAGLLRRQL
jgi:cardiolipin synthase A/B